MQPTSAAVGARRRWANGTVGAGAALGEQVVDVARPCASASPGTSVKPYVERSTVAAASELGDVLGGERHQLDVVAASSVKALDRPSA